MHILFLTDNFPPEVNAPASRTFEHCREWIAAGHQVTVVTTAPNFPTGKIFAGYKNRLWSSEEMQGIRVIRVVSYITANAGFLKRTLDYVSFAAAAIPACLFLPRFDVIVATSPQFFTPCAAAVVSLLRRRPYVFELRDLWPESIRAVGAMKNERALDWLEKLELLLYRRAAAVVSVTQAFKRNLIERGIDGGKIDVVMNGADLSRFRPLAKDAALAARLGLDGTFVAGYVGTHGMAHALETVLEAAALARDDPALADLRFLFLGDGAAKEGLTRKAREMGLDNVVFVDSVPRAEVPAYWSLLDVSLIHLKRVPLFTTVIPSKLFECMAMGIAVLHGVEGESADIVRERGVGLCFTPEDARALVAGLKALHDDRERLRALSQKALAAAPDFDRSAQAAKMLRVLERVAARRDRGGGS